MEKLIALAEEYPSEKALLLDAFNFGGNVYELLQQTDEIIFGGDSPTDTLEGEL